MCECLREKVMLELRRRGLEFPSMHDMGAVPSIYARIEKVIKKEIAEAFPPMRDMGSVPKIYSEPEKEKLVQYIVTKILKMEVK